MNAIVVGATGLTGSLLLRKLLDDDTFRQVMVFLRRSTGITHPKLTEHIIDFDAPATWSDLVKGDVLFSCMGTTLKKAGSKNNQYAIDYTYQLEFAKTAHQNGVQTYILISSTGASSKSRFFYMKMKGMLEDAVKQIPFQHIHIMRPNILEGPRTERRAGEMLGLKFIKMFNTIGLLKKMKPTHVNDLANQMIELAKAGKTL